MGSRWGKHLSMWRFLNSCDLSRHKSHRIHIKDSVDLQVQRSTSAILKGAFVHTKSGKCICGFKRTYKAPYGTGARLFAGLSVPTVSDQPIRSSRESVLHVPSPNNTISLVPGVKPSLWLCQACKKTFLQRSWWPQPC